MSKVRIPEYYDDKYWHKLTESDFKKYGPWYSAWFGIDNIDAYPHENKSDVYTFNEYADPRPNNNYFVTRKAYLIHISKIGSLL